MPTTAEPPRYRFEGEPQLGSQRVREHALAEVITLLTRLQADAPATAGLREHPLLIRYAMDVPLNIEWYEHAKSRANVRQGWSVLGVLLFGLAAMGATAIPPLWKPPGAEVASIATAQIAIFVAMAYGVLQVIASLTDQKQKIAGFAKASADLKEGLFTFEETWRGKTLVCAATAPTESTVRSIQPPTIEPSFASALLQEIATARRTARDERDAYFAARPSPTELSSMFGTAIDAVGRSTASYAELRASQAEPGRSAKASVAASIAEQRQRLIDAKAVLKGKQKRLELLAAGGTAEQLDQAKLELLDAEAALVEAQTRFDMSVKGDLLNPS
jgi:hypothetical protein